MTASEQPTPEAIQAASELRDAYWRSDGGWPTFGEQLALALDRFAAQRAAEAANRKEVVPDTTRTGQDNAVPPSYGAAATPPPGDAGERARGEFSERMRPFMTATCHLVRCQFPSCIGRSNICNTHGEAVAQLFAEHDRRVSELQSERTAAASQALLGAALIVEDEQDRGGSLASAAHRLRAAAASQARREALPLVDAALDWLSAADALTAAKGDRLPANKRLTEAHIALRKAAQEHRSIATPQESA